MKINRLLLILLAVPLAGCTFNEPKNNTNPPSGDTTPTDKDGDKGGDSGGQGGDSGGQGGDQGGDSGEQGGETTPASPARMQDTPILHCWNWSMNNITSNLQNIKDAGFKTIQLSPMQPQKDFYGGIDNVSYGWWKLYQPLGFSIATKDNTIGTKSELTTLCSKAKELGIDVIVDVVSNHLAGGGKTQLNSNVSQYESAIYSQNLIHTTQLAIDDNNLKSVVQGQMGDFPDLQTENSIVQERVLSLLKEYLDCGVNGFRFDAAKHIETPDDGQYKSQFWPTILDGATNYANIKGYDKPYYYGEILYTCGVGRKFSSYTKLGMSVIDSKQGSNVMLAVKNSDINKITDTYNTGVEPKNLVLWGESHDTYANSDGETKDVSQAIINRAYAIQISRKDASSLYLARPNSMNDKLGAVGSTAYKDAEIKAVNKFHNQFIGKDESISVSNGCFVNVRGSHGAVIVNINNANATSTTVNLSGLVNGKYTNLVNGQKVTISGSSVTASLVNGVAVLVSDDKPSESTPTLSLSVPNEVFSGSTIVTANISDYTSATYSINNGPTISMGSVKTVNISSDTPNGPIVVKVTATNQYGSTSKTITLFKTTSLINKSLIIYNVWTDSSYYVWGWKGTGQGQWYPSVVEGNAIGFDLGECDHFIVVKFPLNTTSPNWDNKIEQTEDMSVDHRIYKYDDLPIKKSN